MRRINTPNRAVDLNGPGKDGWRSGNKAANLNPTENSGEFMNIVQEELAAFPEHVGSVLDPNNNHQVLQAVIAMIEARVGDYSLDTGVADAYVVALNPAITAYTGNFFFSFKALHANAGASTINFGGGAVALNNDVGGALTAGDITAGMVVSGNYSLADNQARITSMVQSQAIVLRDNKIINASRRIAIRGATATITAGSAVPTATNGYPNLDRIFSYCTGANVGVAQVAGAESQPFYQQFTGALGVTAIGEGQRIAAKNSCDLNNKLVTIGYQTANSLLNQVTWKLYKPSAAEDTFGTIGTPTKTLIASGIWSVTPNMTMYKAQVQLSASDASLGLEVLFEVGAQTSGTWTSGKIVLREGNSVSVNERSEEQEELLCAAYLPRHRSDTTGMVAIGGMNTPVELRFGWRYPVRARVAPSGFSVSNATHFSVHWVGNGGGNLGANSLNATMIGVDCAELFASVSGATLGYAALYSISPGAYFFMTGCEIP